MGRLNMSVGADYQSLEYESSEVLYSPGGGTGLEGGVLVEWATYLRTTFTAGYQLQLAYQAVTSNGYSNRTSFHFNRKFLAANVSPFVPLKGETVRGIVFEAGAHLNFPGQLRRVENRRELGKISYQRSIGYSVGAGLDLVISGVTLEPTLRYRALSFTATDFTEGPVSTLPSDLRELNANGVELGLTVYPTR